MKYLGQVTFILSMQCVCVMRSRYPLCFFPRCISLAIHRRERARPIPDVISQGIKVALSYNSVLNPLKKSWNIFSVFGDNSEIRGLFRLHESRQHGSRTIARTVAGSASNSPRAINRLASKIAVEKEAERKNERHESELYNLATTFMRNNEARRAEAGNGGLKSTYYRTVPDHC